MDGEKAVITGTVVTPQCAVLLALNGIVLSLNASRGCDCHYFFNQPYLVDKIEMGVEVAILANGTRRSLL